MNEYDSEKVVRMLAPGFQPASTVKDADLVVINTCSVREKGEHKLFSLLGSLRELKRERPEMIVGVMGCVAQQEGETIAKRNSAVDFVVGTHNVSLLPSLVDAVRDGRGRQIAVDYRDEWEDLPLDFGVSELDGAGASAWLPNRVRALVSIQRGCNKNCSYCVVPTTRGKEISRDPAEILREVTLKARQGSKEVLLLGQTVNSFGRDLTPRFPFENLIRQIAEVPGIERIRFTSPHPAEVKAPFLQLYREIPSLAPHIHMPLQSGSDRILKLMNRNYRTARYREIVEEVRSYRPEIAVTTDIIVGFPTETEEDFENTLALVEEVGFHSSFSFKYSRRPNTTAIEEFPLEAEIPADVAQCRLQRLQDLQDRLSAEKNARMVGKPVEVLVEHVRNVETPHGVSIAWGRIPENTSIDIMASASCGNGLRGHMDADAAPEREIRAGMLISARVSESCARGLRGDLLRNEV